MNTEVKLSDLPLILVVDHFCVLVWSWVFPGMWVLLPLGVMLAIWDRSRLDTPVKGP